MWCIGYCVLVVYWLLCIGYCACSTRAGYGSNGSIKIMAKHKYRSWYMKIYAIISTHGFGYIMDHLNETNYCSFLSEFGQQCEDCFVQDWHASLKNDLHRKHGGRNKLRTYKRFKHSFEWESYCYLTYIKSPPLSTALCRLRGADITGPNHYLQISVLPKLPTTGQKIG